MSRTEKYSIVVVFECPFIQSCILPKRQGICSNPECKVYTEYEERVKKLKARTHY
ncbi:MAG: hypothetical protein ACFE9T_11545 [Promethearchaeota archaeon]